MRRAALVVSLPCLDSIGRARQRGDAESRRDIAGQKRANRVYAKGRERTLASLGRQRASSRCEEAHRGTGRQWLAGVVTGRKEAGIRQLAHGSRSRRLKAGQRHLRDESGWVGRDEVDRLRAVRALMPRGRRTGRSSPSTRIGGDYPAKQGIYVIDNHGGNRRRVTTVPANAANDLSPRFSRRTGLIVFTRYRGKGGAEKAALFTVHLDGSDLHQLTSFSIHAGDGTRSPDGRRIVFEAYPNPHAFGDVYVVGANGGRPRNLTRNPAGEAGCRRIRSGRPMDARSSSSTIAACAEWQEPVRPR